MLVPLVIGFALDFVGVTDAIIIVAGIIVAALRKEPKGVELAIRNNI